MRIGVDVGSGFTQWVSDRGQGLFPSQVAPWRPEMDGLHDDPQVVRIQNIARAFVVGESCGPLASQDEIVDTLTDEWSGSEGWIALLYAALAQGGVDDSGEVTLATGVPQALFQKVRKPLMERLNGIHRCEVQGRSYAVKISAKVFPQAGVATASVEGLSDTDQPVGLIDIGTFTTGYAVVDLNEKGEPEIQYPRCSGIARGTSTIAGRISAWLDTHHQVRLQPTRLYSLINSRRLKLRGTEVDLSTEIKGFADQVGGEIVMGAQQTFHGGADLARIAVVGGGADYVFSAIQRAFPQAFLVANPQWAVARGLALLIGAEVSEAV
jgi:Actin like proteins N terminal domain